MNEKEEDRFKWGSIRIIKENLSTDNWVSFNEQYLLVVAKHNKDVHTLIVTGKAPKWKQPSLEDMKPVLNDDTGEIILDGHGAIAMERVYRNNEEGKEDFKFRKSTMRKRIQAYEDAITPCIVTLIQHTEEQLLRIMKLDKQKYMTAYEEDDIVTLYALARFASTGQGADSLYIDLVRMSTIKVENGDWVKFTYLFQELRKRILGSSVKKEDIIEKFFDALFIIRSSERVRALAQLVGEVMCLKEWPSADKCISVWNTMLTTKKNLDMKSETEKKEGALSANMTTLQAQVKDLQNQVISYSSISNEIQALYTKSPSTSINNMICYNCGKKGHGRRRCRSPPSKCNDCGEQHITSQHDAVMKTQKRINSGTGIAKKWTDTSYPKQAHVADLVYDDDPEDTASRQDEDERLEYERCHSQGEDIDNTESSYGGIMRLANFNVTIREDGVGIEVEEPISTKDMNEGIIRNIPIMREFTIDESEYHYLSDDDEDVIETIIPEDSKEVKPIAKKETKIIENNNDTVYYCKDRKKCGMAHTVRKLIRNVCCMSKKVVRTKENIPSNTTDNID